MRQLSKKDRAELHELLDAALDKGYESIALCVDRGPRGGILGMKVGQLSGRTGYLSGGSYVNPSFDVRWESLEAAKEAAS